MVKPSTVYPISGTGVRIRLTEEDYDNLEKVGRIKLGSVLI